MAPSLVIFSLRVLRAGVCRVMLSQMYTERTCPVLPWWEAPYPYDPVSFQDRIGGEDAIAERRVVVLSGGRESLKGEE